MKRYRTYLLAIGVVVTAGCGKPEEKPLPGVAANNGVVLAEARLKFIEVKVVGEDMMRARQTIPGRLEMRAQAVSALGAPAEGRVVSVLVRPGEKVAAGKILATLQSADVSAARAALDQAKTRVTAAEEALRRQTEMMAKGVGVELERIEAETRAREARSELERAQNVTRFLGSGQGNTIELRAPINGVVIAVNTSTGSVVSPGGSPLVEIGDPSRLWAVAHIPEADAASVAKGLPVKVHVTSANREFQGVVDGLGSQIDPETRRLPVYVALQGDFRGLTPGMYADLTFAKGMEALSLPVAAVLIKGGKKRIVYIQRADGVFEPRDVRTGPSAEGRVRILDGIKPGDKVVTKGALLIDGEAEQML
ncbi:MAG: efflux RND transporter periplasmic adaptor subunit [Burkholderiales bacterium]|jgi:cobalt-zinc-cadmium efflux system membrane fusion protein|nr:efflux RND transporter periplasmic adaptor subunit [Burkholderiales bacterium]